MAKAGSIVLLLFAQSSTMYLNSQPLSFKLEALILVVDSSTGHECYRGSTSHEIGEFQYIFNQEWLEDACKFADSPAGLFEEFKECFGDKAFEIEDQLIEILGFPRFDHSDGLEEIASGLLWCAQDHIRSLCRFLNISESDFYNIFVEPDGFVLDRVFEPTDTIDCYRTLKADLIDEEDFFDALSDSPIVFTVESNMLFKINLSGDHLMDGLRSNGLLDTFLDDESAESIQKVEETVNSLKESLAHLCPG